MKLSLLALASCLAMATTCLADDPKPSSNEPQPPTGQDILPNVKLVARQARGENLTDEEKGRAQLMVAYIKGFTDGLHPIQVLYPQGPVLIPEKTTIGEFAKNLEEYLTTDKQALTENCTLVLFNCAFTYYKNPNFNATLMPKRVPVPTSAVPKQ